MPQQSLNPTLLQASAFSDHRSTVIDEEAEVHFHG